MLPEPEELSISELFGRDPLDLTRPNVDRMVEKYRNDRALFAAGIKPAKEKKTKVDTTGLALDLLSAGDEPEVNLDLLS